MSLIRPFRGLRPLTEYVQQVVAPPYDVLNRQEAKQRAAGNPLSFLHISKAEIDLPDSVDSHANEVYDKAAENFRAMQADNILKRDQREGYYVYQIISGEHVQTGLVAVASVDAYYDNRIRKHEFTKPDKEMDRVNNINAIKAQTGPVMMAYHPEPVIHDILQGIVSGIAEYDVELDNTKHRLWHVQDQRVVLQLTEAFEKVESLYIADGHHRSAAAAKVAELDINEDPNDDRNYFLSVLFPADELQILSYNRVVKDLNGLSSETFLQKVAEYFTLEKIDQALQPQQHGEFGIYLDGQWYRAVIDNKFLDNDDVVASLDISLLMNHLITPILGVSDPRRDARIDFIGGCRGLPELERRVNSGDMAVAFALYPTPIESLIAVADADQVMPPKSTWFAPKLADGLVTHLI